MIVVNNVSKYFGAQRAVSELSFTIERGECVGFLGLNGAGKSTTLRLLSCQLLPTAGHISIDGFDSVEQPDAIRRLIGYLPDRPPLYDEMSVREYLAFAGGLRGLSGAERERGIERAVALCDLGAVVGRTVGTLSHGYRQRVGIAQAIIHGPSLLILDEPIQGLDPVQIVEMRKMIGELRGEHTILLSTHILSEIEQTCDRILMMHEGRIAAAGSEAELAQQMQQGRRLALGVRADAEALRGLLQGLSGVSELHVEPGQDGVCTARLLLQDGAPEEVSRAVVEAGMGLVSLGSVATGLESVFLRLSAGASASAAVDAPGDAQAESVVAEGGGADEAGEGSA